MKTKHTPGPWRADHHYSCHSLVYAGTLEVARTACDHAKEETHKADAVLIALAPAMLAELKAIRHEMLNMGWAISVQPRLNMRYDFTTKIIALAEGTDVKD